MTNIYNKRVLAKNGTLVNNWYEEEMLKQITGETRSIPGRHIKKQVIDNEFKFTSFPDQRDNTKVRTLGVETKHPFSNTNSTYGDFSDDSSKFNMIGIKEKIFKDFFTSYLTNEKDKAKNHSETMNNLRLNYTNNKNSYIEQHVTGKIGSRHMKTQNGHDIDQSNLDRLFMAQHDMSKFNRRIPDDKAKEYFNEFVPYYKDKEITFWAQNMDKGNVYKSHSKGINAFGKSSGFTQTLGNTKSVSQYNGNIENNNKENSAKNIYFTSDDDSFLNKYIDENRKRVEDLTENIRKKYFDSFVSKGWMSIRKYKQYLFNLLKRRGTLIDKSDFKYFTVNFGIYLNDQEVDFIYNIYDFNKNSKIDYELMINEFLKVSFFIY